MQFLDVGSRGLKLGMQHAEDRRINLVLDEYHFIPTIEAAYFPQIQRLKIYQIYKNDYEGSITRELIEAVESTFPLNSVQFHCVIESRIVETLDSILDPNVMKAELSTSEIELEMVMACPWLKALHELGYRNITARRSDEDLITDGFYRRITGSRVVN